MLLEYVQPASASKARSAPVLRLATVMQARPYLEVHTMKGVCFNVGACDESMCCGLSHDKNDHLLSVF